MAANAVKFGVGRPPRPPFWSGFRVTPLQMEFWRAGRFRLHRRTLFARSDAASAWSVSALFP